MRVWYVGDQRHGRGGNGALLRMSSRGVRRSNPMAVISVRRSLKSWRRVCRQQSRWPQPMRHFADDLQQLLLRKKFSRLYQCRILSACSLAAR
ncbi:hypothetical protein KCP75_19675 [Salmonella enterica subsp. enterica]|nr:hypothetical protein KCP75_19675 [Salmonella enterica subsp. enterica]